MRLVKQLSRCRKHDQSNTDGDRNAWGRCSDKAIYGGRIIRRHDDGGLPDLSDTAEHDDDL